MSTSANILLFELETIHDDLSDDLATDVLGYTEQRQLELDLEAAAAYDVQDLIQQDNPTPAPSLIPPPSTEQDSSAQPFAYHRSAFKKQVHVTFDDLLGKKRATKTYLKGLAAQPARGAFKVQIMLKVVLADLNVQRVARSLGLASVHSMLKNADSFFSLARYLTEPILRASGKEYCYLHDDQMEFHPYKVVSNWPTLQDAWQLARRQASTYSEAKLLLETWKAQRLVPGTTLGAVPSFTTTKLRKFGLTDRQPSIVLADNQFLMFDNSNSGKKPQRECGQDFQACFRFLNLVRILVTLSLGGSLELVLSAETGEDLEAAIQLGVQQGLLYSKSTRVGMNSLSSGKITSVWTRNTSQRSLFIFSYAPTISMHRSTPARSLARQDLDITIFKTLAPSFRKEDMVPSKLFISFLQSSATKFGTGTPQWVHDVTRWAKSTEGQVVSEVQLEIEDDFLYGYVQRYLHANSSQIEKAFDSSTFDSCSSLELITKYWYWLGCQRREAKTVILNGPNRTDDEIELAINCLLAGGAVTEVNRSHPAFAGLSDFGFLHRFAEATSKKTRYHVRGLEDEHGKAWEQALVTGLPLGYQALAALRDYATRCPHLIPAGSDASILNSVVEDLRKKRDHREAGKKYGTKAETERRHQEKNKRDYHADLVASRAYSRAASQKSKEKILRENPLKWQTQQDQYRQTREKLKSEKSTTNKRRKLDKPQIILSAKQEPLMGYFDGPLPLIGSLSPIDFGLRDASSCYESTPDLTMMSDDETDEEDWSATTA